MSFSLLSARPDSEQPEGGERQARQRRAVREAGRRRDDGERENESTAKSVTPRPDVQDGQTADGGQAGGGKKRRREADSEQEQRPSGAIRRRASEAFSEDARRPPPGGRRKRSTRPACEHKRRGPAPHLAKPGVQPGAESDGASGGLGVPRALPLARGMSKPVASGENACTRDDGSGGPVTARSGGTTDHAAERNAGSGQAGSVTERSDGASPCGTRTAWSGAGPGRTSPTTLRPGITQRAAIAASVGLPPHARASLRM